MNWERTTSRGDKTPLRAFVISSLRKIHSEVRYCVHTNFTERKELLPRFSYSRNSIKCKKKREERKSKSFKTRSFQVPSEFLLSLPQFRCHRATTFSSNNCKTTQFLFRRLEQGAICFRGSFRFFGTFRNRAFMRHSIGQ